MLNISDCFHFYISHIRAVDGMYFLTVQKNPVKSRFWHLLPFTLISRDRLGNTEEYSQSLKHCLISIRVYCKR